MIDYHTLQRIIDKVKDKVSQAEAFYYKGLSRSVSYKGWKLHTSSVKEESGFALRVVKDGRIGFSATSDPKAIDSLAENAVATALFGDKVDITFPAPSEFPDVDTFDPAVEEAGQELLVQAGDAFVEAASKHRDTCDMEFEGSLSVSEWAIANTSGLMADTKNSSFSIGGEVARIKEGDVFFLHDSHASCHIPNNIEKLIADMTAPFDQKLKWADNVIGIPSGHLPVIFAPRGIYALLVPLGAGINGRNIYTKASPIVNKLDEQIFDTKLTIISDGIIDDRPGSSPFDDEGIARRKLPIIENGILKNFVFDLVSAAKSGMEANGSASRSLFSTPYPDTGTILIRDGNTPYKKMLEDIKEGLLIEGLLGVGQANVLSGAFSNPAATVFKIENGKIVGRVKDAAISGNIYEHLKEIAAISDKGKWIYGGAMYAPYIRLDNLTVTAK